MYCTVLLMVAHVNLIFFVHCPLVPIPTLRERMIIGRGVRPSASISIHKLVNNFIENQGDYGGSDHPSDGQVSDRSLC